MKPIRQWPHGWIAMLLIVLGIFLAGSVATESGTAQVPAQNPGSPSAPATPPELFRPDLPPSEINNADAVFRKLDVAKRGYVTLEDTTDLLGFEQAFRAVDSAGSGKLTPAQFRKAWSIYKSRQ